jgi:hypothetical protein
VDLEEFPDVYNHLVKYRTILLKRAGNQRWYELQQPATGLIPFNTKPKIVYPIIANECRFTLDRDGYFINDKLFILPTEDTALLAILNSRLANFYFSRVCAALEGANDRYLEFRAQYVDRFPIPTRFSEWPRMPIMQALVEQMLSLHEQLASATTPQDQTVLQRQIDAVDRQIDQLVYELYDLMAEEIRIVEQNP